MRIGLVSTLGTNWGDDLVREGVCRLLREVLNGRNVEWVVVNKHAPQTVYPRWHPVRALRRFGRGRSAIQSLTHQLARAGGTVFDRCDFLVQCGTPVLWPGCARSEWSDVLWREVLGRLSHAERPVLNLGAGSCYPWKRRLKKSPMRTMQNS